MVKKLVFYCYDYTGISIFPTATKLTKARQVTQNTRTHLPILAGGDVKKKTVVLLYTISEPVNIYNFALSPLVQAEESPGLRCHGAAARRPLLGPGRDLQGLHPGHDRVHRVRQTGGRVEGAGRAPDDRTPLRTCLLYTSPSPRDS